MFTPFCLTQELRALIQKIHLEDLIVSQLNPINAMSSRLIKIDFCINFRKLFGHDIFNIYSGIYLAVFYYIFANIRLQVCVNFHMAFPVQMYRLNNTLFLLK